MCWSEGAALFPRERTYSLAASVRQEQIFVKGRRKSPCVKTSLLLLVYKFVVDNPIVLCYIGAREYVGGYVNHGQA